MAKDNTAPGKKAPLLKGVKSKAEQTMCLVLGSWFHGDYVREFKFHPKRKWRFDFAWPAEKVAVEIEGITFTDGGGRHQRGLGFARDCHKYLAAQNLGWTVLRVPSIWLDGEYGKEMDLLEATLLELRAPKRKADAEH